MSYVTDVLTLFSYSNSYLGWEIKDNQILFYVTCDGFVSDEVDQNYPITPDDLPYLKTAYHELSNVHIWTLDIWLPYLFLSKKLKKQFPLEQLTLDHTQPYYEKLVATFTRAWEKPLLDYDLPPLTNTYYIETVMSVYNPLQSHSNNLMWRVTYETGEPTLLFIADCSDLFALATADAQRIEEHNLDLLITAAENLNHLNSTDDPTNYLDCLSDYYSALARKEANATRRYWRGFKKEQSLRDLFNQIMTER